MKSRVKPRFIKLLSALPRDIRRQAYVAYRTFLNDPFHPGLQFKEVNPRVGLWSARINESYRVLGYREADEVIWFWIGKHDEYIRLIRHL